MKKQLLFKFLISLLLTVCSMGAWSQSNNVNIQVNFNQGFGVINSSVQNQTFISKAAAYDPVVMSLLNQTPGATNNSSVYVYRPNLTSNTWGPYVYGEMGTIYNTPDKKFRWEVFSWANATSPVDVYNGFDTGAWSTTKVKDLDTDLNTSSKWTLFYDSHSDNSAAYYLTYTWRYAQGDKINPLDFGTITTGTKTHINHNRSGPVNSNAHMGYENDWPQSGGNLRNSNDVTYKFTITDAKEVTISTDYANTLHPTNGLVDSYITLLNASGTKIEDNNNIGGNPFNYNSKIIRDLCPGTYLVVVEGFHNHNAGEFTLSVGVDSPTFYGGKISRTGSGSICPFESLSAITSDSLATSTLGNITYSWEKRFLGANGSSWTNWFSLSGTGVANSNLGGIGNSLIAEVRRKATASCGNIISYSNSVAYNRQTVTVNAGTITSEGQLPLVKEKENIITSVTPGSASVSSFEYSWYQSIDEGLNWTPVVTQQNTADFTIPEVSTMGFTQANIDSPNDLQIQYKRRTTSTCQTTSLNETSPESIFIVKSNGGITGHVTNRFGSIPGTSAVTVYAHRFTPVAGGIANKLDSALTDNNGQYSFDNLYYGRTGASSSDQASYYITPVKELHGFEDDSLTVTLSKGNINSQKSGINFKDTTSFFIQGHVIQYCALCDGATQAEKTDSLKGVVLRINGQLMGDSTTVSGMYGISKETAGTYVVKPELPGREFNPFQTSVEVGTNNVFVSGVNFVDTTTHVISGQIVLDTVSASCAVGGFGVVEITFTKILDPGKGIARIKRTIDTHLDGSYSVRLPAGKYKAAIQSVVLNAGYAADSLNAVEIVSFLNNAYSDSLRTRDISEKDTTMTLIYYEKPKIRVSGLDAPNCNITPVPNPNAWDAYTIFEQGVPKTFTVEVFRGDPVNGCKALPDTLKMATNIQVAQGDEKIDTLIQDGKVVLTLIGGEPNTTPPDYVKTLSFNFKDQWGRTAVPLLLKPIVTGVQASTGSFLTVSPQIPFLILRDPPGDGSYSYWENNTSTETVFSIQNASSTSIGTWVDIKLGAKFEAGVGFSTESEFYAQANLSMNAETTLLNTTEKVIKLSSSTQYSTDATSELGISGEQADLFLGGAINLKYSDVKEVIYDTDSCKFRVKRSFMMADSGFATTFVFTENHIRNTLLPILRDARDLLTDQGKKDSARNQINVWEQTLLRNQELKRAANFEKNYSFDGVAGPIEESKTNSSSDNISIEFDLEFEGTLGTEFGMEIGGAGVKGGSTSKLRITTGDSRSTSYENSTTVGYVLDDGDPGDFFSVNIKNDPVYNTPVFELAAGTSSCPHELGTKPRDKMNFSVINSIMEGVAANDLATFQLKLSNQSETGEDRSYYVRYVQGSADGTIITLNNNPSALSLPFINMPYNQPANTIFAKVGKEPLSTIFSHSDVRFQVYDGCSNGNPQDPDIVNEVSVRAEFVNPCSPISLSLPADNFTINAVNTPGDIITVEFKDYVYAQSFNEISFQYAAKGSSTWYTPAGATFPKNQISNSTSGTQKQIDITALADGEYKFRAELTCGINTIYSKLSHGVIDRKRPLAYGTFQPADKNYVLGDVISATFNENLSCQNFEQSDFTLKKKSDNSTIPAILGCYQNQVIITPNSSILPLVGDSVLVTLSGVTDAHGNENPNTFSWKFGVGTSPPNTSTFMASVSSPVTQIAENSSDSVAVTFTLSQTKNYDNIIYYNLGGNAVLDGDYASQNQNRTQGYQGSVTIDSNTVSKTIYIKPMDDAEVELDEEIRIELVPTKEYGLMASNALQVTILNDDILGDDCDNNGQPFNLSNNNGGSTAIIPGTYHKLILNSNGIGVVDAPTTVVFKGEKSITLNPGFKVESGSVFSAILEDCPQVSSSFAVQNTVTAVKETVNNKVINSPVAVALSEYAVEEMNQSGEIVLNFTGKSEFGLKAVLMDKYTNTVTVNNAYRIENAPNDKVIVDTQNLTAGTYHLKMEREGRTFFHRLIISK